MKRFLIALTLLTLTLSPCTAALADEERSEIHWGILAGIETVDLTGTFDIGGNIPCSAMTCI